MQVIFERLTQLQQQFSAHHPVDSYRIFHGRGRCFPGLEFVTVDYFQPVLLVTLFNEPPEQWIEVFTREIASLLAPAISVVILQRRYLPGAPSELLYGTLPEKTFAQRGDLRFNLHIAQQQNSGYFLDMEPGRCWLAQHAKGKRILNLFAYSCAFSVVAVAAGAEKVINVDMSSAALNLGRANHQLNHLDKQRSDFLAEDILKSWGRIKRRGPYNLVIIDPPSYQKGSFIAEKDYSKVIRRLPELMPEGGLVLACLNAPELGEAFLRQQFSEQCALAIYIKRLESHPDFPDIDPEQQLKVLVYELHQ
jgi:23S rRNA (cytosine1962-C5)-methyltransferase